MIAQFDVFKDFLEWKILFKKLFKKLRKFPNRKSSSDEVSLVIMFIMKIDKRNHTSMRLHKSN